MAHKLIENSKGQIVGIEYDYPELRAKVPAIVTNCLKAVNEAARQVKVSDMPYKAQWILEEVIKELQSRV